MQDEAGFLDAIREDPGDDVARLVYADWLDERGDVRAEYLRVEHQLAQATKRLAELRGTLDPTWLGAVAQRKPAEVVGTLSLQSGRTVYLTTLRQGITYAGVYVGRPDAELNQEIVARVRRSASITSNGHRDPYLVPPVTRPIAYPEETLEAIPPISCIAELESLDPARDTTMDASALVVVWFQDHFAFPIDPQILDHLRGIDWEKRATDFAW